jgi:NAD-specific glutamate dehydrogenase
MTTRRRRPPVPRREVTHGSRSARGEDRARSHRRPWLPGWPRGGARLARVVCEGGNLGVTTQGRIEYASSGGWITGDFIDNAAGVHCSDREVNIKILLEAVTSTGQLGNGSRDALLASMTSSVAQSVLADQHDQALAISRETLAAGQRGPTRPELAGTLAETRQRLRQVLLENALVDHDWAVAVLRDYFPAVLWERYPDAVLNHPLRREIVATRLACALVIRYGINRMRLALMGPASELEMLARRTTQLGKPTTFL